VRLKHGVVVETVMAPRAGGMALDGANRNPEELGAYEAPPNRGTGLSPTGLEGELFQIHLPGFSNKVEDRCLA
jgi:hypothetical protein